MNTYVKVLGFATHHEPPLLFPTYEEAFAYCDDGEEPIQRKPDHIVDVTKMVPLTDEQIRQIEAAHGIKGKE